MTSNTPSAFLDAEAKLSAGRIVQSAYISGQFLKQHPRHPLALRLFARACMKLGQPAKATECLGYAIQAQPGYVDLVRLYRSSGRLDLAIEFLNRGLVYDKEHAEANLLKAEILLNCTPADAAVACLQHGGSKERERGDRLALLARALASSGRTEEARRSVERAKEMAPKEAQVLEACGRAMLELDDVEPAVANLVRAWSLDRSRIRPALELAELAARGHFAFGPSELAELRSLGEDSRRPRHRRLRGAGPSTGRPGRT